MAVTFASTGETHTYAPDGTRTITQGTSGALAGTAGDDIFVNATGSSVDAGDGDDTIFNIADDTTIIGGKGNDTVLLPGTISRNAIDTGEGDDSIIGNYIYDSSIVDREGNNALLYSSTTGGKTELGDGNNTVIARYDRNRFQCRQWKQQDRHAVYPSSQQPEDTPEPAPEVSMRPDAVFRSLRFADVMAAPPQTTPSPTPLFDALNVGKALQTDRTHTTDSMSWWSNLHDESTEQNTTPQTQKP